MLQAAPYLREKFNLPPIRAKAILFEWMKDYDKRNPSTVTHSRRPHHGCDPKKVYRHCFRSAVHEK